MPKNKVSEWSSIPSNNTDVGGINIAEGCPPSGINNALREIMAQVKDMQAGTDADNFTVGGNLTVTGAAALGGNATATTPGTSDNSTKLATTAYVTSKIAASTSGLADPGGPGIVSRTATTGATVARTITAGTGISVSNGDGVSANPTITNTGVTSVNGQTGAVSVSSTPADGSITAAKLSGNQTGSAPIFGARAWVNFDGTRDSSGAVSTANTNRFVRASGNVSSVMRNAAGDYTITFNTAMSDENYAVSGTAQRDVSNLDSDYTMMLAVRKDTQLSGSVRVRAQFSGNTGAADSQQVHVTVFR